MDDSGEIVRDIARLAAEDLELRPMLQRVSDAIARRLGAEFVALVRVDHEPARFVCEALTTELATRVHVGYGRELGSGVVGRVAQTGEPIVLDDVRDESSYVDTLPGVRSELCVPIRHRGRVVAVLNLESPRVAAFRGLLPLVLEIAQQLSGVVASAMWVDENRRRTLQLELLSEVSRRALEVEDLDERLLRIATLVRERLDLELVSVLVADERGARWRHRAIASRLPLRVSRTRWPVTAGVVGRAIRRGSPQLVLDVASDPDYLAVVEDVTCEYVLPLRLRERLLGAMNVEARDRAQLASENLALLAAVADQIVGPLELGLVHRQLRLANRRLDRLSSIDPLTRVANRRSFDRALDAEWRRCERTGAPVGLALLDLDAFKLFNDTQGHPAGDALLRQVARALRDQLRRASDLVARYGGEEFVFLMPGLALEEAIAVAESARGAVADAAWPHAASPFGTVTLSAGVASVVPSDRRTPGELVAAADRALYRAKREGRNRVAAGRIGSDGQPAG